MFQRKHISLFAKTFLILSVIFIMVLPMLFANNIIKGITDTSGQAANAWAHFSTARYNYLSQLVSLWILDVDRAALTVSYKSNKTTMEKEAIELATAAIPTSVLPTDLAANLTGAAGVAAKMAITAADDLALKKALVAKTLDIQKKKVVVSQYKTTLNEKYNHYVDHIDAFNCSNETPSDDMSPAEKGEIPSDEIGVDTNLEVKCSNPDCSTVYTVGDLRPGAQHPNDTIAISELVTLSEGHHLVSPCQNDHGVWRGRKEGLRRDEAPSYWSCPPNYPGCPHARNHILECPGGCGEYNVIKEIPSTNKYIELHLVHCNEDTHRDITNLFIFTTCYGTYYSCEGVSTCTSAFLHIDDDEANAGGTTPTTPMHVCDVHELWQSGDHSWQTSCSDTAHTNTNGDSCQASGFYACVSHTPVYPSSDNGNNDDDDDDSGDSVVMVTCFNCLLPYNSSDAAAVEHHTVPKSCVYCSESVTGCNAGYYCDSSPSSQHFHGW